MTAIWLTCKAYYVTPVKRILPPKSGWTVRFPLKCLIIGAVIRVRSFRLVPGLEVLMHTSAWSPHKCDSLRRHASLNPHPEGVGDFLFRTHPFFDPYDLVQVKYEMLRRVIMEGKPVGVTAATFGFSRVTWAQLHKRFEEEGLAGLLPQPKGPRRASKVSEEVLAFVQQTLRSEPALRMGELPERIAWQFGICVHVRSLQRALANSRKKESRWTKRAQPLQRFFALDVASCRSATRCYATWPWKPTEQRSLSPMVWSWLSSSAREWQPGWKPAWQAVSRLLFRRWKCKNLSLLLTGWFWPWWTWWWVIG